MKNSSRARSEINVNTCWKVDHLKNQVDKSIYRNDDSSLYSPGEIAKIYDQWPEQPRQINDKTPHAPSMQPDLIPERLRGWITDIAERMQMPPEIVVTPALVGFSCVVGKKIGIYPKKHDDWMVVPNLWGGLVAPFGFLKSAAITEALLPLKRLRPRNAVDKCSIRTEQFITKAKASALKELVKAATKYGDVVTIDQLKTQIEELVRDAEHKKSIIRPFDTTNSKRDNVSKLINESPNGLLIIKGHLDNWLRRLSKKKCDDDREFFLQTSNGASAQACGTVQTRLAGPLSIFGELTPSGLQKHLSKARYKKRDISLLRQIQLLIYPDSYATLPAIDRKPNYLARESAIEIFQKIDDVVPTKSDYISAVRFSDEAQEIHDQWAYELKLRIRHAESENALFSAHIAKYYSLMPSLALLFSILERPENIHGWNSVSSSATNLAVRWCLFLEGHAKKAYSINQFAQTVAIKKIATSIEDGDLIDGSTLKSIYRQHEGWPSARELVRRAFDTLEELGWLRVMGTEGLKRIALHPKFQNNTNSLPIQSLYRISKFRDTN